MRAVIYCRISLDATGEELGVTRQLEDCTALLDSLGWTLVETFIDNDISASSGKPRPQYRAMLGAVKAGDVDAVIAWHPDRLYRKLADLEELIVAVEKNNVILRTVRAGEFDLATPTGRMLARILASVSAGEGEIKADRWKRSIRQRREQGRMPGSGPRMFGWTREGEIIDTEAEIIRWMAQEVTEGCSLHSLARKVEAAGILTTNGNAWARISLRGLLLNPRLAGWATLNGEIVGRGQWPAILEPEHWETVKAALTSTGGAARRQRVSLLVGMIWCGGCGTEMVTGSRVTKTKALSRTYRCSRDVGRGGCMKVAMQAEGVEEIVETYARERLSDPRVRARIEDLRSQPGTQQSEIADLELRLTELEHQLDEPGVPVSTILRAIDRAKERQERLLSELSAQPRAQIPRRDQEWPTDLRRRRALVDLVVERVTINPSTLPGRFDPTRVVIAGR